MLDWIPSGISLLKIRKKREPNIEPWGTPARILLFAKKRFIKIKSGPLLPYDLSLYNKPSFHTLSKALDLSKNTPPVSNEEQTSKFE